MLDQLSIPKKLLERCPACFYNFARLFFIMTCAPNQADFIRVVQSNATNRRVEVIDYHLSADFARGLYASCSDLALPALGPLISTLMCAKKVGPDCSADSFLASIGARDPSPMQINFHQHLTTETTTSVKSQNYRIVKCNEVPAGFGKSACDCVDCKLACPATATLTTKGFF